MLRDEVMSLVAETRKLETASIVAVAALYAWLSAHTVPREAWYIGVPLVLLAGIRSIALFHRVGFIARYMRLIEAEFLTTPTSLPGYERYFAQQTTQRIAPSAIAFWVVILVVTLVAPSFLAK